MTAKTYTANDVNEYSQVGADLPAHDANGNLTQGNGKAMAWDAHNRLLSVAPVAPVDGDLRAFYQYDGAGRRISKLVDRYDAGLAQWVADEARTFAYDGWNLVREGVVDTSKRGGTPSGIYDEVGNYNLTYDDAGNLLGDGTRVFEWDARNRLTAIETGDHRSELEYDSLDRRIRIVEKDRINSGAPWTETTNETYLWVGNSLAEKRDSTGGTVKVRYLGQGEQRIGGTDAGLYYYTRDHLGSVRELVDASGNVRARYDYGLWGRREKIEGDLEAEFGFTGHHVHSETWLYLALYRVYDAKMGRWLSADPIAEDGGLNLYAYVGNDPVNAIDPLGLDPYILNRQLNPDGLDKRDAVYGPVSHTFVYTTNPDGSLENTYSWGNTYDEDGNAIWHKNEPVDRYAANDDIRERKKWGPKNTKGDREGGEDGCANFFL